MPRRTKRQKVIPTDTMSPLETILLHVDDASENLPEEERRAYEEAEKSIVEAQRRAEVQEGHVRIL